MGVAFWGQGKPGVRAGKQQEEEEVCYVEETVQGVCMPNVGLGL